jgi:hypothetical protein
MLAIILFILGFYYRAERLLSLNFLLPLIIVRPYLFSFDIRVVLLSLIVFLLIQKILPNQKLVFNQKANYYELLFCVIWTFITYYVVNFVHYAVSEGDFFISHLLQLKWYVFWIILKKQSKFGFFVRVYVLISLFLFDGRTELFLVLFLLIFPILGKQNKYIYKYYPYTILLVSLISLSSLYTAARNISFQKNIEISEFYQTLDSDKILLFVNVYLFDRFLEAESSTKILMQQDPKYFATFSKLPEILIPRYFWPNKGSFLPGIYYNFILTGNKQSIISKNLEVGFIGIWWHNFGYFFVFYAILIFLFVVIVRNFNSFFLLLFLPKLFGDYNQIPGILESILFYFIIYLFYVSYTHNRQFNIS